MQDNRIIEYVVIDTNTVFEFERSIKFWLERGYQPYGSPTYSPPEEDEHPTYFQVVVLRKGEYIGPEDENPEL